MTRSDDDIEIVKVSKIRIIEWMGKPNNYEYLSVDRLNAFALSIQEWDGNLREEMTFDQFQECINEFFNSNQHTFRDLFNNCDLNHDQLLNRDEFANGMVTHGINREEATIMFNQAAGNNGTEINFDDFLRLTARYTDIHFRIEFKSIISNANAAGDDFVTLEHIKAWLRPRYPDRAEETSNDFVNAWANDPDHDQEVIIDFSEFKDCVNYVELRLAFAIMTRSDDDIETVAVSKDAIIKWMGIKYEYLSVDRLEAFALFIQGWVSNDEALYIHEFQECINAFFNPP
jgi:hypothetical protein